MQIKIFTVPVGSEESQIDEMNHFLRANKIVDVKRELAMINGNSCWTFCVTYLLSSRVAENEGARRTGMKIDYKEILSPEVFERFSNLRKLRKQISDKEAVPAYAVFTDAELSEIAKLPVVTVSALLGIEGIGNRRVEKYADVIIANQQEIGYETGGASDGTDSKS